MEALLPTPTLPVPVCTFWNTKSCCLSLITHSIFSPKLVFYDIYFDLLGQPATLFVLPSPGILSILHKLLGFALHHDGITFTAFSPVAPGALDDPVGRTPVTVKVWPSPAAARSPPGYKRHNRSPSPCHTHSTELHTPRTFLCAQQRGAGATTPSSTLPRHQATGGALEERVPPGAAAPAVCKRGPGSGSGPRRGPPHRGRRAQHHGQQRAGAAPAPLTFPDELLAVRLVARAVAAPPEPRDGGVEAAAAVRVQRGGGGGGGRGGGRGPAGQQGPRGPGAERQVRAGRRHGAGRVAALVAEAAAALAVPPRVRLVPGVGADGHSQQRQGGGGQQQPAAAQRLSRGRHLTAPRAAGAGASLRAARGPPPAATPPEGKRGRRSPLRAAGTGSAPGAAPSAPPARPGPRPLASRGPEGAARLTGREAARAG